MTRGTSVVLGPVTLAEGELIMRSPQLRHAEAWSSARLANRTWLERAFPAHGPDWAAEQSPTAWVERYRQLRRQQRHGACPLVVLLDGRLIGEVGIDAIDVRTAMGEASAWLVRDHGGPDVMVAASALLVRHVFTRDQPLDRILSPVATTSRRGREPGLSAVGFGIEATAPRPLGSGEVVDHDMWIVHNTADVRAMLDTVLADLDRAPGRRPARSALPGRAQLVPLAPALGRVLVRSGRRALAGKGQPEVTRRVGFAGGVVDVATDVGTATTTFVARLDNPDAADALTATISRLADDATRLTPAVQRLEVRLASTVPPLASGLTSLGFTHVATYRANPDGPHGYAGEQVWSRPVTG